MLLMIFQSKVEGMWKGELREMIYKQLSPFEFIAR